MCLYVTIVPVEFQIQNSDFKMTDSKYFTTTKKGEIFELKSELNSDKKERKREAVKKVIASMTVGKVENLVFEFHPHLKLFNFFLRMSLPCSLT